MVVYAWRISFLILKADDPLLLCNLFLTPGTYDIPEPQPSEKEQMASERGHAAVREDLKRFRKEYAQPVQLR